MHIEAPDVDTYLEKVPAERRDALVKFRVLCREVLKGYEECLEYGMPCYKRNGTIEVGFASQKQYISLYVLKRDVVDAHREALADCNIGKGCIRFRNAGKIDFKAVRALLRDTAKSRSLPC